ncbi:hypothetical protein DFS34DRAFT_645279 [Phlyctochytrium arcticum]|nr:hypothetical protein DFS34DRAFT_645279 [Phlyctochytrium arcticum]
MPSARLRKATTMEVDDLTTAMAICTVISPNKSRLASAAEPFDFESDSDDGSYEPSDMDSDASVESEDEEDVEGECEVDQEEYQELVKESSKQQLLLVQQPKGVVAFNADDDPDNDDTASQYYPSDDETEEGLQGPRPSPQMWKTRAETVLASLSQAYQLNAKDLPHWIARLRKFNKYEQRWMDKGPVLVYSPPGRPDWLCANYLYGMRNVALNMKIPEHWTRYQSFNGRYAMFSTCGHNGTFQSTWQFAYVPVANLIPLEKLTLEQQQEAFNSSVMRFDHRIVPVQEKSASILLLKFADLAGQVSGEELCDQFRVKMGEQVRCVQALAYEARYKSFTEPQSVWGVNRVSMYGQNKDFVAKLAGTGMTWHPHESLEQIICTQCAGNFTFSDPSEDPVAAHRAHNLSIRRNCPFVFAPGEAANLPVHREVAGVSVEEQDMARLRSGYMGVA